MHAKYVGRVGVLAVALGIGAPVLATTLGSVSDPHSSWTNDSSHVSVTREVAITGASVALTTPGNVAPTAVIPTGNPSAGGGGLAPFTVLGFLEADGNAVPRG